MIINEDNKTMEIEPRDVDYVLPAYVRLYLFQTKNEDPEKIIYPMFSSVRHPSKQGVTIPIEYVDEKSPEALAIIEDGSNIPEATPESEAAADRKEDEYDAMKGKIAALEEELAATKGTVVELDFAKAEAEFAGINQETIAQAIAESTDDSPAKAAFKEQMTQEAQAAIESIQPTPARIALAKQPEHMIPPGMPLDLGGARDAADQKRIARDLIPEKDIKGEETDASDIAEHAKGGDTHDNG